MDKRTHNWTIKISEEQRERFRGAAAKVGIQASWAINNCIESFCQYVEEHGEITLPLAVIPRSRWLKWIEQEKREAEIKAKQNEIPD